MANAEDRVKNHPDCDIIRVDALHIRALHLPPVRCMMAQGSCAVSGVITVTNNYCFSALYASNIRVTTKTMLPVSTCTWYITDCMFRHFLLSALASVLMPELSRAVLARGAFESTAVTYK